MLPRNLLRCRKPTEQCPSHHHLRQMPKTRLSRYHFLSVDCIGMGQQDPDRREVDAE
jgi:hypothetical protein